MADRIGGRGRQGGRGGRGGRTGNNHSWQQKMFIKLIKDGDAKFHHRDVDPFLQGMNSFQSKPELLMLLTDQRNYGQQRIHDCLSMIAGSECVDKILRTILLNVFTKETARPLHKNRMNMVVTMIFNAPGLVDFLATDWIGSLHLASIDTANLVCELLLHSSLLLVEARSSEKIKTLALALRDSLVVNKDSSHQLCAVLQIDNPHRKSKAKPKQSGTNKSTVACWGADLDPPGGKHDNDCSNFRDISLVPTQEELSYHGRPWLPLANGENSFVDDPVQALLDRNFRLLREDAVGAIKSNMADPRPSKIWKNARIIGASCQDVYNPKGTAPLYFLVQLSPVSKSINWERQRCFPIDGLIIFCNDANTHIMASTFVRISNRQGEWLNDPGGPIIGVIFHHQADVENAFNDICINTDSNMRYREILHKLPNVKDTDIESKSALRATLRAVVDSFKTYTVTEVSDSFFAYKPVLESLQSMISVPLSEELVHCKKSVQPPTYLPRKVKLPDEFNNFECDLDNWSHDVVMGVTTLDESQSEALHTALSSRVALIQGPPGCGKTFIGSLIAQIIRDNSDESILCVCYTNHALDQFLEHMLKRGEQHLVRIGGRTKSELLKPYELKALSRKEKSFSVDDSDRRMRSVVAQLHRCKEEMTELLESVRTPLEWYEPCGGANELFHSLPGGLHINFKVDNDNGFNVVGKNNTKIDAEELFKRWRDGKDCPLWLQEHLEKETDEFQNLWHLGMEERLQLLNHWRMLYLTETVSLIQEKSQLYKDLSAEKMNISSEIDARILCGARIIGATTTGAAKYRELLSIKSASVVIVEEAGEVLEPHVLAALTEEKDNSEETKHLILIGDHLQLRPKLESYSLCKVSGYGFDFDVSLFERLIMSGMNSSMLRVQHRMRPCISEIIRQQTYPTLQDHPSVSEYPKTMGVPSNKDLLFLHHTHLENGADDHDTTTKSNSYEAKICIELVRFFLLQGYGQHQITVLTPYVGQILNIAREMKTSMEDVTAYISDLDRETLLQNEEFNSEDITDQEQNKPTKEETIRCASIDNFQGEESDIIIISLVRSNKQGSIGFLKEEQRVNVLLSRAKHGMFIIGNADTLRSSPKGKHVWNPILDMFVSQGRLVTSFPTICQRHPDDDIIECMNADDFRKCRPNGGCCRPCDARLECGHVCPFMCHPTDRNHTTIHKQCIQPCRRIPPGCPHNHPCTKRCNEKCGPCLAIVEDTVLPCGHVAKSPSCSSVCDQHSLLALSLACQEKVSFQFSQCNHICVTMCSNAQLDSPLCPALCGAPTECGHSCKLRCHLKDDSIHLCEEKCERILFCGHVCGRQCHGSKKCPPCSKRCEVVCEHSRCTGKCQNVCASCVEECDWSCKHQGRCGLVCSAPCNRLPCDRRCEEILDCGHQCPSVCGEKCLDKNFCVYCCTNDRKSHIVDMLEFNSFKDHNIDEDPIIFLPCSHFYAMSTLDGMLQLDAAYERDVKGNFIGFKNLSSSLEGLKPKSCPDCRTIIHSVKRYGRVLSFLRLRALEIKHMMMVDAQIVKYSRYLHEAQAGRDRENMLKELVVKLDKLELDVTNGPMMKVYQACSGKDLDVPSPPTRPLLELLKLRAMTLAGLVQKSRDDNYKMAKSTFKRAIVYADATKSKHTAAILRIRYCRMILNWHSIASVAEKVNLILQWVINEGVDETLKNEAKLLKEQCDSKLVMKGVLNAMHVIEGYDYGGGWSSHWFQCPNGHPFFIGECGGAMQVGRCIECGAEVGGGSHQLLATNSSAREYIEEILR